MFGMFLKRYMNAFMNNMGEVAKLEEPMHEPEVCGGTGRHDGQSVDSCDECAEHGPWEAEATAQLPDGKTHISRGAF